MSEQKRNYLLFKISKKLTKVDPDIFYEIVNVNPEYPRKKFNKFSTVQIHNGYVYVCPTGSKKKVFLARYIIKAKAGQIVDHRNRDRLDNRRENLRIVTARQNSLNKTTHTASGFIGVSLRIADRYRKRPLFYYQVRFRMGTGKKEKYFGVRINGFSSLYLAAIARDKFVLLAGEEAYAPLNFPQLKDEPYRSNLLAKDLTKLRKKSYEEIKAEIFKEKDV